MRLATTRRKFVGSGMIGLGLFGQSLAVRAQDSVKLGLIVPLSGPWARQGEVMRIGAEMAIDHINAAGGIASLGGRPVELVVFDTGDSVERAKNAAQRMVAEEPDLVGITGSYLSSFTLAVSEVTERASLPMLTLSYSDLITGRGFDYIFQTSPTGVQQAEDALLDVVTDRADGVHPLAGRVGELPVEVLLAGVVRALVAATHRDHHVGRPALRDPVRDRQAAHHRGRKAISGWGDLPVSRCRAV